MKTVATTSPSLLSPHSDFTLLRNDGDGDLSEELIGDNSLLGGVVFPADIDDASHRGD